MDTIVRRLQRDLVSGWRTSDAHCCATHWLCRFSLDSDPSRAGDYILLRARSRFYVEAGISAGAGAFPIPRRPAGDSREGRNLQVRELAQESRPLRCGVIGRTPRLQACRCRARAARRPPPLSIPKRAVGRGSWDAVRGRWHCRLGSTWLLRRPVWAAAARVRGSGGTHDMYTTSRDRQVSASSARSCGPRPRPAADA